MGVGGEGWSVTGSRVLGGGHSFSSLPGLDFLFPLGGMVSVGGICVVVSRSPLDGRWCGSYKFTDWCGAKFPYWWCSSVWEFS